MFKADPHPVYARLREEAPVFRTKLGVRRQAWLVARYDDVAALLRDPRVAKDPLNVREPGGVFTLLQHPGELGRLRRDPALIGSAVEELIRFTSPVEVATERYAREDVVLAGVPIRRGEMVLGLIGSANRDGALFAAPDTLDLAREPNRHLGFGLGAHYCLGAPLARLETRIAITSLLEKAPDLRLAVRPDAPRWRKHVFLRGLRELPVLF